MFGIGFAPNMQWDQVTGKVTMPVGFGFDTMTMAGCGMPMRWGAEIQYFASHTGGPNRAFHSPPTTEANRLAHRELPPTRPLIHWEGIRPSEPGLPSNRPATRTPTNSRGIICLVKSQVDKNQDSVSPRVVVVRTTRASIT